MEQKVYTQSGDIPASESKAAGFPWSLAGRNPIGLGRTGRKETKRRWRETESWVPGEAVRDIEQDVKHVKIMFPGMLYKTPVILQGQYPQFINDSSLSTTLRLLWSLMLQ